MRKSHNPKLFKISNSSDLNYSETGSYNIYFVDWITVSVCYSFRKLMLPDERKKWYLIIYVTIIYNTRKIFLMVHAVQVFFVRTWSESRWSEFYFSYVLSIGDVKCFWQLFKYRVWRPHPKGDEILVGIINVSIHLLKCETWMNCQLKNNPLVSVRVLLILKMLFTHSNAIFTLILKWKLILEL